MCTPLGLVCIPLLVVNLLKCVCRSIICKKTRTHPIGFYTCIVFYENMAVSLWWCRGAASPALHGSWCGLSEGFGFLPAGGFCITVICTDVPFLKADVCALINSGRGSVEEKVAWEGGSDLACPPSCPTHWSVCLPLPFFPSAVE